MKNRIGFNQRLANRKGQSLVEYSLILALIAIVAIVALAGVGGRAQCEFALVAHRLGANTVPGYASIGDFFVERCAQYGSPYDTY